MFVFDFMFNSVYRGIFIYNILIHAFNLILDEFVFKIFIQFFFGYRDTAGQERFRTITTAYYRGAMVGNSSMTKGEKISI